MLKINLNKEWKLTYENLSWGPEMAPAVLDKKTEWIVCDVPCDVHMPLIEKGIIKEPLEALNCYDCQWMEDKSWWFRKVFTAGEALFEYDTVGLTAESLDAEADIFLNGFHLGHHKSAFYPFEAEVKKHLKPGENTLLIRASSGLEHVSEQDIAAVKNCVSTETDGNRGDRGDKRRAFVRKPQYAYGWDWGPRVATCGIMKDVYIKAYRKIAVNGVHVVTRTADAKQAGLTVKVQVENLHVFKSFEGTVHAEFLLDGRSAGSADAGVHLRSGFNYVELPVAVEEPALWWPNGMGPQSLYAVRVWVEAQGEVTSYPEFKYGIRTLCLNMDSINSGERLFALEINGVKTFCKGGNWIPADSIYGRVTDEKYDTLIREARDCHFTMLRIWGGGFYEKDIFYEKCDEYGILVWHDFMFACAMYPDNLEWFRTEAERELDYQTRRLRNHSCIALWCGNNENHWGFSEWWIGGKKAELYGGAICYNKIAPAVVERNCPNIPYWNSSPYGGDEPNSNEIGDRHHWNDCTMNSDMSKRITPEEYDKITSKFITEYGYIGPCAKSTIVKYHGGHPVDRDESIWKYHNNTFEKDTVLAGITKHYTDADNLDMESYLLYAGLCQGLMYQYSLEAIRCGRNCWGSLFWMYDDCWGEVGWTIIDYYLKRKPSYYYVKRAFAPVKLILREAEGTVRVVGINETGKPVRFGMEYGYVSFDGNTREVSAIDIELPPFFRDVVFEFRKGSHDFTGGLCHVKPLDTPDVRPAVLRTGDFRTLKTEKAVIRLDNVKKESGNVSFEVSTDVFAHAVHFGLEEGIRFSDEYFDLLPGEGRRVTIFNPPENLRVEDIKPVSVVAGGN